MTIVPSRGTFYSFKFLQDRRWNPFDRWRTSYDSFTRMAPVPSINSGPNPTKIQRWYKMAVMSGTSTSSLEIMREYPRFDHLFGQRGTISWSGISALSKIVHCMGTFWCCRTDFGCERTPSCFRRWWKGTLEEANRGMLDSRWSGFLLYLRDV